MKLFTIGYEGATQGQFIDRLKGAGVELVADVRAVARRAKPIVGAEMNCTVIGRRRRDLLLSFDPG